MELWEQVEQQSAIGADAVSPSKASLTSGALPAVRVASPGPETVSLPSLRPADDECSAQTTVDRPVSALRLIDPEEARQLAECFAVDYLSCDADAPDRRRLALEPYLSRRPDALLGWPGGEYGRGRHRAVHARAGGVLTSGHVLTVDVRVLVEIFDSVPRRVEDATAEVPADRQELLLPPGSRKSSVPVSTTTGWVPVMSVWQRLGVPVRRHDRGHLVVELQQLPSSSDG
ncbi:hypothetical protein [Pseudonocardia sp. ICBG1293]|uniref:hypothetical protein n=1 Tax=Pseudonocardia sp. ICBG1293 TaxID=2844382 RepID=UPI001CCAA605|nr:hypothetical protein [Pseudonocardia sp. ICBG1293]